MSKIRTRDETTYVEFDDQSQYFNDAFKGNWTKMAPTDEAYVNSTLTYTTTPGSTLQFSFDGPQVIIFGILMNSSSSYPSATYMIDGSSPGDFSPWMDDDGSVIYYQSPKLSAEKHAVQVTVSDTSDERPYAFDYILFAPRTDMQTSGMTMRETGLANHASGRSSRLGYIIGGTVAGVVLLILITCIILFMRRRPQKPYYFIKPATEDLLGPEHEVAQHDGRSFFEHKEQQRSLDSPSFHYVPLFHSDLQSTWHGNSNTSPITFEDPRNHENQTGGTQWDLAAQIPPYGRNKSIKTFPPPSSYGPLLFDTPSNYHNSDVTSDADVGAPLMDHDMRRSYAPLSLVPLSPNRR